MYVVTMFDRMRTASNVQKSPLETVGGMGTSGKPGKAMEKGIPALPGG